jgi:hypothetical protein
MHSAIQNRDDLSPFAGKIYLNQTRKSVTAEVKLSAVKLARTSSV